MLFRQAVLEGIAEGRVTLAFRRWTKPTVKPGGTLRTAIGVLAIDAVDEIEEAAITEDDAREAGYADRDALLHELAGRPDGRCFRIAFHREGDDPRIALRQTSDLGNDERTEIERKLAGFDRSAGKDWTLQVLRLIAARDGTTAAELSAAVDMEKLKLKARIRKLKELGLTESLTVGYRLSARGHAYLEHRAGQTETPNASAVDAGKSIIRT